jgi:hypothetical protein
MNAFAWIGLYLGVGFIAAVFFAATGFAKEDDTGLMHGSMMLAWPVMVTIVLIAAAGWVVEDVARRVKR